MIKNTVTIQGFAIIISNVAVVDLVEIAVDVFEVPRLVPYGNYLILLFQGPCV